MSDYPARVRLALPRAPVSSRRPAVDRPGRACLGAVGLAAVLAPTSASAAPPPDDLIHRCGTAARPSADALRGAPETIFAVEDIPGNAYPRKHTLYMNFGGAELNAGADNSAENFSTLARQGPYPAFDGDEATAVAAAQGVANDVAAYGIRVVYAERPPEILPYTMAMIGGNWTDTNLDSPAGGVAPIADCGALGQRHVVYVFADGGWGAVAIANVTSQEAGHAWGLDHNLNCGSVMSYCGGGDGVFSSTCDGLCEEQCQGAAGCRLTHEMFCGEGSDQQNEAAELAWIFGGNEPDLEPPSAEIVEPVDGATVEAGASVDIRAVVDDNYGGFGWRFTIERDGEVVWDEVDYDREVDADYRAALNLVGIEAGEYVITLEVRDQGDQSSFDTVTLHVTPSAGDDGGDGDGGSATASGTGADGTTGDSGGAADAEDGEDGGGDDDSGDGSSGSGAAPTADDAAGGCACDSRGASGGWLAPLIVVFAGIGGRRGRRNATAPAHPRPAPSSSRADA